MPAKRDLRTGRSIWQTRPRPRVPAQRLRRSRRCDVLVVGAGISGALVAEALADAGFGVIVADRRGPVQGSTPASTALVQHELDMPLTLLARRFGRRRAEAVWRRSRLAVAALLERTRRLGIDADLEVRETLYLDGNVLDARALAREAEARRRAGFDVEFLDRRALRARFGIAGRTAILSGGNLSADPCRLTAGYLNAAIARGAELFAPVTVTELTPGRRGVSARTQDGPTITAHHVVLATGYELFPGVPARGHRMVSTWAMATAPQREALWPTRCLIWEASDPYLYLRAGPEGCIICGGEDEPFADEERRDALIPAKTAALEARLAKLLPHVNPHAAVAWTGTFGASVDGAPSIGRVPRLPRCHAVLGYGGNGITFSMMAAQMLRSAIAGERDLDAPLFAFGSRR